VPPVDYGLRVRAAAAIEQDETETQKRKNETEDRTGHRTEPTQPTEVVWPARRGAAGRRVHIPRFTSQPHIDRIVILISFARNPFIIIFNLYLCLVSTLQTHN